MRKLLFLLLCTVSMYGQAEFDAGIQITGGQTTTSISNKLLSQESDGVVNYIPALSLPLSTANISALQKKADLSTGLIKNGLITINADPTKYDISAGIGIISNFDDPENPVSTLVSFSATVGKTPTYLNTGNITYVAINSAGTVIESASQFTVTQRRDLIILGAVIHSNLTSINVVNNISAPTNAVGNQLHDFMEAIGALNITGNKYTANGANLQLNKSAGSIFKFGVNFATNWKDPHELSQSAETSLTFRYRIQNGTEGSDRINLDPALYDLGNVLTAVPNNKFTIQTVTMFQTGLTRIQYGQTVYDDLASAQNAIFTRDYVVENNILMNGVTRAYIILKNTTTSLQNTADARIVEAQKFGGVASGGVALTFANIVTALGYTPENLANKATDFTTVDNIKYPTVQAVKTYADGLVVGLLHNTGNETKSGTLGVNGIIYNPQTTAPTSADGLNYKITQPTTTGQSWSKNYTPVLTIQNGLLDQVKNKPATFRKKVMIYGSSVALGEGATGSNGWANRLATDLTARGFTIINHSIGGNNTASLINRFYTDVAPENPDFLIISLGLGNEGLIAGDKESVYNSFKKGLQKLILMCKQHGIIPILGNSYSNNGYSAIDYNYVKQINSELDSWGVPVFNFLGANDDLTGKWVAGSFTDALHPNDAGHQEMYKSIPPSMFDCLMNGDYRITPEKGSLEITADAVTERPIQAVFDGVLESFTVAFWMKVNDSAGFGKAFAGFGTGNSRIRNPHADTNPPLEGLRYTTNSDVDLDLGVRPEETKAWYHIAVTYNSIAQLARVYLDGVFKGEISDVIDMSEFTIGGRTTVGFSNLNAINTDFKDVLVYRTRMSDLQIKELYNGNILKSSLEIYSPMGDKNITLGYRLLNMAPTYSYLKLNSIAFTPKDKGVISSDITGNSQTTSAISGTTNYIPKFTGTNTLGPSLLYDNGTNLGIGTTTPFSVANQTSLSVNGTNASRLDMFNGNVRRAGFYADATLSNIGSVTAIPLTLSTSDTERIRITPTGSVGIGTTTPIGAFNVFTSLSTVTIDIANQQFGSIAFSNGGTSAAPIISGKSNDNMGLSLISATNNINSTDMRFDVRENDNTDFATLTSSAFKFNRFGTTLIDVLRNGNTTFTGSLTASSYFGGATLTGTPTAPTATAGTNTTQIATTAFVQAAVTSGVYTPTLTNTTNVSSSTLNQATYTRIGNIVTVVIGFQIAFTTTGTDTVLNITLPIATTDTTQNGIGNGNVTTGGGATNAYGVVNMSTTTSVNFTLYPLTNASSAVGSLVFQYNLN